jgi:hypothetical protein
MSAFDFAETIAMCDPEDFTVERQDEGQVVDGIRQRVASQEFEGAGVFVPADAKVMDRLDQNTRTREVLVGYTSCAVRTADVKRGKLADKLTIHCRDETFQVHEVSNWSQGGYYEITVVRVGQ